MPRVRSYVLPALLAGGLLLGGCSASPPVERLEDEPTASPVSYPVPSGCPSADDFSEELAGERGLKAELDLALLGSQLAAPLLEGGCAYANATPRTVDDGSQATYIDIAYFNLGESGRPTSAAFASWAQEVGGSGGVADWTLPDSYSGRKGASAFLAGGDTGSGYFFGEVLPEYVQGEYGVVQLWLDADRAEVLIQQGVGGAPIDPTTALAGGLELRFGNTFDVRDDDGYTVRVAITGSLPPFIADVQDAVPGEFYAASQADISGTLTNTTTGRNTDAPSMTVIAVYPVGSAACANANGVSKNGGNWGEPDYCAIKLGVISSAELGPDASITNVAEQNMIESGPHPEGGEGLAQLNSPVSLYAMFRRPSTFPHPDWVSDAGCVAPTESWGNQSVVVMDGWPEVLCDG